ncbi:hypothetical protein CDAR_14851 [Caerostris darwini]|uniref:Uncharacterized protein n=1 Tax=Caerostris darwini TaxID=1538125 RepID=A0AAV4W9C3_9ARAC|nr:hypothetical protein CDAR_14851 [Caerostris darwini]
MGGGKSQEKPHHHPTTRFNQQQIPSNHGYGIVCPTPSIPPLLFRLQEQLLLEEQGALGTTIRGSSSNSVGGGSFSEPACRLAEKNKGSLLFALHPPVTASRLTTTWGGKEATVIVSWKTLVPPHPSATKDGGDKGKKVFLSFSFDAGDEGNDRFSICR